MPPPLSDPYFAKLSNQGVFSVGDTSVIGTISLIFLNSAMYRFAPGRAGGGRESTRTHTFPSSFFSTVT